MAGNSRRGSGETPKKRRGRPASTPEEREQQLIAAAVNLAEKQLRDGTASAQVTTHYLKMGSSREKLEQERLANENELLKARVKNLESASNMEALYVEAISMMRIYTGQVSEEDDDDGDY